jgi:hypothetical protein
MPPGAAAAAVAASGAMQLPDGGPVQAETAAQCLISMYCCAAASLLADQPADSASARQTHHMRWRPSPASKAAL